MRPPIPTTTSTSTATTTSTKTITNNSKQQHDATQPRATFIKKTTKGQQGIALLQAEFLTLHHYTSYTHHIHTTYTPIKTQPAICICNKQEVREKIKL